MKDKVIQFFKSVFHYMQHPKELAADKPLLTRAVLVIIALDFIAFVSLSGINPIRLLNPFEFLISNVKDKRAEVTLYYPRLEFINQLKRAQSKSFIKKSKEKAQALMKELTDTVESNIIGVKEKLQLTTKDSVENIEIVEENSLQEKDIARLNVRLIIQSLLSNPESEKVGRIADQPLLLKKVWSYDGKLYIQMQEQYWKKLTKIERKVFRLSAEKSIEQNLKLNSITWVL